MEVPMPTWHEGMSYGLNYRIADALLPLVLCAHQSVPRTLDFGAFLKDEFGVDTETTHYALILATARGNLRPGNNGLELSDNPQSRALVERDEFAIPGGTIAMGELAAKMTSWEQQQLAEIAQHPNDRII